MIKSLQINTVGVNARYKNCTLKDVKKCTLKDFAEVVLRTKKCSRTASLISKRDVSTIDKLGFADGG